MASEKKYQIIQKLENDILILHPETEASIVKINGTNAGVNATDVESAIKEVNNNIKAITGGGVVTGVKGEAETEYRLGNVNITKANIGLGNVNNVAITQQQVTQIGTNKTNVENLTKRVGTNETNINTAQQTANEAKSIAEGRAKAVSFDTYASMVTALKGASNTAYKVGDNLFIKDKDVPDYWVSGILTSNTGTTGYYEISELEAQKVDLTTYQQKVLTASVTIQGSQYTQVETAIEALAIYTNDIGQTTIDNAEVILNITKGITKVGDSSKLNGKDPSYYLDYNNFTNKPTIPTIPNITITPSGSGNFVKNITASGHTITKTLGNISNSDLPNSGVTAGTYSVVSVNAKGVVTNGANLIEVGASGQSEPSSYLAIGGLFFKEI